jgi:hypothetical protein
MGVTRRPQQDASAGSGVALRLVFGHAAGVAAWTGYAIPNHYRRVGVDISCRLQSTVFVVCPSSHTHASGHLAHLPSVPLVRGRRTASRLTVLSANDARATPYLPSVR